MNELKTAINDFIEDLATTETAIIEIDKTSGNRFKIVTYSRISMDGDSVNIVNDCSEQIMELQKNLLQTSLRCKKAQWNFAIKALS